MVDSREVRRRALQDADLKKLRRKLLFRFLLLFPLTYLIGVAAMALVIDGALQDPFARFFLALAQALGGLSEDQSLVLYHNIFRDHKGFWTALLLVCIFFSLFFLLLRQFTRYLRLVDDKLDELLVEQVPFPVELPPELEFLDEKMNRIKEALKERQLAAQESEQRKNDLVVYLAHDIKTPLTSVIGYLSLLEEAPDMPAAQRAKYTHITLEKAYRLEDLINQFFDITRFNLQHIVLEKEPVRLDVMLAQLADEFYPMLAAQGKWAAAPGRARADGGGGPGQAGPGIQQYLEKRRGLQRPQHGAGDRGKPPGGSGGAGLSQQGQAHPAPSAGDHL